MRDDARFLTLLFVHAPPGLPRLIKSIKRYFQMVEYFI